LWSTHTIGQLELGEIVRGSMHTVRSALHGGRIPSDDGDPVVPVDIAPKVNFKSSSPLFGMNLGTLKSGKVWNRKQVFNLADPAGSSGNTLVTVGAEGKEGNQIPREVNGIAINEDVSSLIFLHACARPAANQKSYFNIPNFFDSADLLGWYEIVFEDGYKEIIPIQYGVNILEWNPGGEKSLDTREGDTGSPQSAYCYMADPIKCSPEGDKNPVTFFAFEWVNTRFGKVIREVNLHGSKHYQSLQQDYGKVVTAPMASNAVMLAGISKVVKRMPFVPK
jgi:hypothetical protein